MRAFNAINGTFNTIVSLTQNGLDMAPTPAIVHTYESGCKDFTTTLVAWKTMQTQDLTAFNALLAKSNLSALKTGPTTLTAPPSCTLAPVAPASRSRGGK